jgi:hypothetical protein
MLSGGYASGTLDNVIQSMVDNARKKLILAAVTSQALMAWAFASGRVETERRRCEHHAAAHDWS